ncbi:metal-dependent hydrolase [Candidatus Fukatsuia symbiotica]|uniref:Metal-dependent hydrolase n=1 Tax=Candidatus Fukatsuia symbiotica TaxID=1878942 RepID=A0A2U8I428_9GAMM|nr:metal-dependent hydrolase [Candidatus Fukatsuia symbiotica]
MPSYFIDTHCHFDFSPFSGTEVDSLAAAHQAQVKQLIVPAVAARYFDRVLALARDYPALFAALGLHPLYLNPHQDAELTVLADRLATMPEKLVAVGEIGLDLYQDNALSVRQQLKMLQAQLMLAKQYDLPVILHSRRSHDQLAALLRKIALPRTGVIHGFAGSLAQARTFIRLGYYIGVGGIISYQRAKKTRQVMAELPLNVLLLETDAPYMPLSGFQGQANRPERITDVFAALCRLRPESPQHIAQQLHANSQRLFNLPPLYQSTALHNQSAMPSVLPVKEGFCRC